MTARRESSTYKGQVSHWNINFKLTYRSSQTDPITASNSALAVVVSIKEVQAESLVAIGVAVAFCYFFAKETCFSMLESKVYNKKTAKKVIGLHGYERREYKMKTDF